MSAADAPYIIVYGDAPFPFLLTGEEMTVGRSPDRDVYLNHTDVSRAHASFTRRGEATFLTDLESSNGTFVNGSRLQGTIELHDGDQINFATIQATFHVAPTSTSARRPSAAAAEQPSPFPPSADPGAMSHPPLRPPGPEYETVAPQLRHSTPGEPSVTLPPTHSITPQPPAESPPPDPGAATEPPAARATQRPLPQAALEHTGSAPILLMELETRIGRVQGNDVVVQDSQVSSQHALIRHEGGQFYLVDLGSANGTYVNGRRITEPHILEPGDEIGIGRTDFFFRRLAPVPKKRGQGGRSARPRSDRPPET